MRATLFCIVMVAMVMQLYAQKLPGTMIADLRSGAQMPCHAIAKKGRVTLISFWATWCNPGKGQVKTILRKLPEWKKFADFDYVTIIVDQPDPALARRFAESKGWHMPCYIDAGSALKPQLNFVSLPLILVVDKEGNIAYRHNGYEDGTEIAGALRRVSQAR